MVLRPADEIAADLSQWLKAEGRTQAGVAAEANITQPHLSRILAGMFKPGRSAAAERLCNLAGVPLREERTRIDRNVRLMRALERLWDGTPEDAERLADLLVAAGDLRHRTPRSARLRVPPKQGARDDRRKGNG
jgi:transcriptional regulator with XRE-family HTH domain